MVTGPPYTIYYKRIIIDLKRIGNLKEDGGKIMDVETDTEIQDNSID